MLERILRYLLVLTIACSALPGCAYMTKSGRQQLAYQRYIKKCSGKRVRMVKMKAPRMPSTPPPSKYQVTSGVVQGPQSVSSGESQSGE